MEKVSSSYSRLFRALASSLEEHSGRGVGLAYLGFLTFRLDFNEYYANDEQKRATNERLRSRRRSIDDASAVTGDWGSPISKTIRH